MAKALDDDEFIYQLQLEEIRKAENPAKEIDVLCDRVQECLPTEQFQIPRFCDAREIGGRGERNNNTMNFSGNVFVPTNTTLTDIPREQPNFHEYLADDQDPYMNNNCQPINSDIISAQFNLESLESPGSFREMNGGNGDTVRKKAQIFSPTQYPTEYPYCESTRCGSLFQKQCNFVRDNGTDVINKTVNENQNTQFNGKFDGKPNGDRLVAQQVQLEMDKQNIVEQDRILAEEVQLEVDLESAKELDKHNNYRRRKSRLNGSFKQGHILNIRQKNVDLPQYWSNSLAFGMQRETERQNIHPFQQHPNQEQSQQLPIFRGSYHKTTDQERLNPFQYFDPPRTNRPTTTERAATEAVHLHRRRHPVASLLTPTQETQRDRGYNPQIPQHPLLTDIRPRSFRRHGSNFQGDDIDVDGLEYEELLELEERLGEVKIRGLQQSDINTLPKETINDLNQIEEKRCVICQEDFQLKSVVRKFSCCHNMYHSHCIDTWLKQKSECPVCKKEIKGYTSKNR